MAPRYLFAPLKAAGWHCMHKGSWVCLLISVPHTVTSSAGRPPELSTVGSLNASWQWSLCPSTSPFHSYTLAGAAGSQLTSSSQPFPVVPYCRLSSVEEVTRIYTLLCVAQEAQAPRASPVWCWRRGHQASALARKRRR